MNEISYGMSNSEIIAELGRTYKKYRLALNLSQEAVAKQTGLSTKTIGKFETGKAKNLTMQGFLSLMRAIGMLEGVGTILPDIPLPPKVLERIAKKERKRASNGK